MTKYQKKFVPYFVTSFSVLAAMLLIMVKPNVILRFVSRNIWDSLHSKIKIKISDLPKVMRDYMLVCNNIVSSEDFSVLTNGNNNFKIKLQESLLIHRDGPQLNRTSE